MKYVYVRLLSLRGIPFKFIPNDDIPIKLKGKGRFSHVFYFFSLKGLNLEGEFYKSHGRIVPRL